MPGAITTSHDKAWIMMKRSYAILVCLSAHMHNGCLYDPHRNQTGDASGIESANTTDAASHPTSGVTTTTTGTGDGGDATVGTVGTTGTDPLSLDTERLLATFPNGCVSLGVGAQQLRDAGILVGGDNTPITCELRTGRGMGSGMFGEDAATMPPGISIEDEVSCVVSGTVSPALPVGIYGFITTFTQSGVDTFIPYCAPQKIRPPSAYAVRREDDEVVATFKPGLVLAFDAGDLVEYGTEDPDPIVLVTDDIGACTTTCYYAFVYSYNTLSSEATVSGSPNAKFPDDGFEGFTHAIRVQESNLPLSLHSRPFVVNITFDYCIANNKDDCGNEELDPAARADLIRENGGGSNYYFTMIVLPQ